MFVEYYHYPEFELYSWIAFVLFLTWMCILAWRLVRVYERRGQSISAQGDLRGEVARMQIALDAMDARVTEVEAAEKFSSGILLNRNSEKVRPQQMKRSRA
jgi:hypothetical protein